MREHLNFSFILFSLFFAFGVFSCNPGGNDSNPQPPGVKKQPIKVVKHEDHWPKRPPLKAVQLTEVQKQDIARISHNKDSLALEGIIESLKIGKHDEVIQFLKNPTEGFLAEVSKMSGFYTGTTLDGEASPYGKIISLNYYKFDPSYHSSFEVVRLRNGNVEVHYHAGVSRIDAFGSGENSRLAKVSKYDVIRDHEDKGLIFVIIYYR